MSVKFRTILADTNNTTYDLTIPIFKNRNFKEWLEWVKNVERAAIGKKATTGPAKFLLAKRLLEDKVLQAFKNAARTAGAKTTQTTRQ